MTDTHSHLLRDKERTREALLNAAAQLFFERGTVASMATIAAHAGVSKGALTHHFPTRASLEVALVERSIQDFRVDVAKHLAADDHAPGRLLRAYVRALTSDEALRKEHFSPTALITVLGSAESTQDLIRQDAQWWREAFLADGCDPLQSLTVRAAAEGAALSIDTPYMTEGERDALAQSLIAHTQTGG